MRRGRIHTAGWLCVVLWGMITGHAAAADVEQPAEASPKAAAPLNDAAGWGADRETTRAALELVNEAVIVQADGRHNRLLRALRHLQDPSLGPLFLELSRASHPSLRVHGILGVAELNRPRGLTIHQIAAVDRSDVQAELIGAALDGRLIDQDTRLALLGWQGLSPGVKLLLATPRVAAGDFGIGSPGHDDLAKALDDEALGRRGLAALLLAQLGDDRGRLGLDALIHDTHPSADAVRGMLLETAWTHGLNGSAGWAYRLADTPGVPPRLQATALKVAIRFGDPQAEEDWARRFTDATDLSIKTRLAWVGLEAAPWIAPDRFEPLVMSEDELISQLGRTGRAVALTRAGELEHPAVEAHVVALIKTSHPQACRWAAAYAKEIGSAALAAAVVMQTEPGEPRGRARRLDAVVRSVQTLVELEPDTAERLLSAALQSEDADPAWQRGVLLGLIRSRSESAIRVVAGLPPFPERETEALALLVRLQHPEPLSDSHVRSWELVVRGGVDLDDSLRIQAAWAYLARSGQSSEAIAAVLAEP